MSAREVVRILGVPFSKLSFRETVDLLKQKASSEREDKPFHLITANPEIVMKYQEDLELQQIMQEAGIITPDGIGIVLASRWRGQPIAERVTGYELLLELLELGSRDGLSFYFLGADEETSRMACEIIRRDYPGVRIVGRQNGFFGPDEELGIVEHIGTTEPDFLIVAMGAPRAEQLIFRYKAKLNAKVAMGVGGSLDVIAGKVKRAPEAWQRLNLEWLYRLLSQPSRWRRQLTLPVFAVKAYFEGRRQ
ncbi:WecB/TagA/CpsF family glycosyltransferase [Paenibacillus thalictri]|uniref:N-acetylglucosaminyldiphosphoundecaprenol N-acetyl-beta-D-mannosaminyltransferase n=1 Tax=Paenibacillus thalictri TaxID=2527873 RepID=A0A4Q9DIG0_9BACL|nr:WecB/TagA/CpsF family glycosyltransferase [Paenibacillus thalictri]TBL71071.1 glycosyltransferase [Paenibacillus thalictri]